MPYIEQKRRLVYNAMLSDLEESIDSNTEAGDIN